MNQSEQISHPVVKGVSVAAAGIGALSWPDIAAILASIYTLVLMGEWAWKKVLRPYLARCGWIERRVRKEDE